MSHNHSKALIIANCQVQPLKHALAARVKDILFEGFGVHLSPPADLVDAMEDVAGRKDSFKFVLSFVLSDDYGPFSFERIVETFYPTPVIFITNIYFSGLHPDLTYIGGLGFRLAGPTGDYHSRIAAVGYASEMQADEIIGLYNDRTYQKLDYYMEFHHSLEQLRERDKRVNIKFADRIEGLVRSGGQFFSMNHPSARITDDYAAQIAQWLSEAGLSEPSGWNAGSEAAINHLAGSVVMPVFPEICRIHHLPYEGSYAFKTETVFDEPGKVIGLDEFVRLELQAFSGVSPSDIASAHPINIMLEKYGDLKSWLKAH